jgi:hypothetical protein
MACLVRAAVGRACPWKSSPPPLSIALRGPEDDGVKPHLQFLPEEGRSNRIEPAEGGVVRRILGVGFLSMDV